MDRMSRRAMIIEDDVNSAKVLAHLLNKNSIDSVTVMDYRQLASQEKPDIVFIYLEMPQRNGYEVLEELLKDSHYQSIPIVATSVHTGELKNVQAAGFSSFISKPLSKDKFPKQLSSILNGEAVWDIS
jgi:CheY-like chemotaxis protein